MEFLWWQICLVTLSKGIAWCFPILTFFLAISWLITDLTKEVVEKVKKKYTEGEQ